MATLHLSSQHKRSAGHIPKKRFNEAMSGVVLWIFCVLTKEAQVPLIKRQPKC